MNKKRQERLNSQINSEKKKRHRRHPNIGFQNITQGTEEMAQK